MSIIHASAVISAGSVSVRIDDQTVSNIFATVAASAGIKLTRGGQFQSGYDDNDAAPVYVDIGGAQWASTESVAVGDAFECRLDTTTGSLQTGTANAWLAMTSDREFACWIVGNGVAVFTGTLSIRRVGGSVLDTAAISLTATVDVV